MLLKAGGDFTMLTEAPIKDDKIGEEDEAQVANVFGNYPSFSFGGGKGLYGQMKSRPAKKHATGDSDSESEDEEGQESKVKLPDHVGSNIVHIVSSSIKDCIEWYKFFVEKGGVKLNVKREDGRTELLHYMHNYPKNDNLEVFNYLINNNCDINATDKKDNTPIFYTCDSTNTHYMDRLLSLGCNLDILNKDGASPLIKIVKSRNLLLVQKLIENKANINFLDVKKRNALHWAVNNATKGSDASNELENYILSHGCDPLALDINNRTPLHYAFVKIGSPFINTSIDPIETVSNILAREKALQSINVRDNWGNTPLHYASQRNAVISSFFLIKKGAELESENNHGNTPLYVSLLNNHMNMSISLLQSTAKITKKVAVYTQSILQGQLQKKLDQEKLEKQAEKKRLKEEKKLSLVVGGGMELEKNIAKEDDIESESEDSVISDDSETPDKVEEEEESPQTKFGGFGRAKAPRKKLARKAVKSSWNPHYGRNEDESDEEIEGNEDKCDLGKTGDLISPFMVSIKRDWQGLSFLILESGFDISLAVLDCFQAGKLNYVYTLLLKKEEGGFYQMKNDQGQNIAHLFSQYSCTLSLNNIDLYNKIYSTVVQKKISFEQEDNLGRSCLHYAASSGNLILIKELLQLGLQINKKDNNGDTPFSLLIKNSFQILEKFFELVDGYHLDVNQKFTFKGQETVLSTFIVTEKDRRDYIKYLTLFKNKGGDLNLTDSKGYTPLILLIRENMEKESIQLYEQLKPSLEVKDKEGKGIIHHIISPMKFGYYQNETLLNYFAEAGADLESKDYHGHSPMYYASLQKNGVMKKRLVKLGAHMGEITENNIERATSSILNNISFPVAKYDFEEDFNTFNQYVDEEERKNNATKAEDNREQPHDLVQGGNYEVIYEDGEPYSTFMVKVEISRGYYSGNTFYRMQLLRDTIRGVIVLFTNWGRNGTEGQYQHTPFGSEEEGKSEFSKIFRSKSGNKWEDRANFKKVDKKYRLVSYKKQNVAKSYLKKINYKDSRLIPSQLDSNIFKFMRRICNSKIISNSENIKNYMFDWDVMPYHNLTKDRLEKALSVLNQIKEILDTINENRQNGQKFDSDTADLLTDLTNEFYELVPTTQYRTTSIPTISQTYQLDQLFKTIYDLIYSEICVRILCGAQLRIKEVNPVDYCFNSLSFKVMNISKQEEEYQLIR